MLLGVRRWRTLGQHGQALRIGSARLNKQRQRRWRDSSRVAPPPSLLRGCSLELLKTRICAPFGHVIVHPRDMPPQAHDWSRRRLRLAVESDVTTVAAWFVDPTTRWFVGMDETRASCDHVHGWMQPPRYAFVLEKCNIYDASGRPLICAFISIEPLQLPETVVWEVGRLIVSSPSRRHGFAETLVRRLYGAAREVLGFNEWIVSRAVPDNHTSLRMCARVGLTPITPPFGFPSSFIWLTDQPP